MILTDAQIDQIAERIAAKLATRPATYDIKGMAAALHVSTKTIQRLHKEGILKTLPCTSRLIFPASELERITAHV